MPFYYLQRASRYTVAETEPSAVRLESQGWQRGDFEQDWHAAWEKRDNAQRLAADIKPPGWVEKQDAPVLPVKQPLVPMESTPGTHVDYSPGTWKLRKVTKEE